MSLLLSHGEIEQAFVDMLTRWNKSYQDLDSDINGRRFVGVSKQQGFLKKEIMLKSIADSGDARATVDAEPFLF